MKKILRIPKVTKCKYIQLIYSIYNDLKQRNTASPQILKAGTRDCLGLFLGNSTKVINQSSELLLI